MSSELGITGARSAFPEGPVRARGVNARADPTHELWQQIPALLWFANPRRGNVRFRDVREGSAPPVLAELREPLAIRLLKCLDDAERQPFQRVETLSAPDGSRRSVLVVGFPLDPGSEAPQARIAGLAIDVTRQQVLIRELAQQALMDELTGLYNLRGFTLFAEHDLKVARRQGTQCAVVYVDVDRLKQINDAHGHRRGDDVLVATGKLLRRVFRECDVIGRLGGDEFAVFAADVNGDPALLARRLSRASVEISATEGWSVTAGVGSCPPDPGLQLAQLLAAADQAMYRGKSEKFARGSDT